MSLKNGDIPLYGADGRSFGFRTLEVALKLLAAGNVSGVYGPRKKLKALFLKREDGGSAVEAQLKPGMRYSFQQRLGSGYRAWKHKRLDGRDEDGTFVDTRGAFERVVRGCMR